MRRLTKTTGMLLTITIVFNALDIVWTVYAVNEWSRLGCDGISEEMNPISKHVMVNYGLNVWIGIKLIISLIGFGLGLGLYHSHGTESAFSDSAFSDSASAP